MRVLLVGGGVTNSLISYFLKDSKIKFTCWEKARGLGGRFATKRNKDGLKADHGAQVRWKPDTFLMKNLAQLYHPPTYLTKTIPYGPYLNLTQPVSISYPILVSHKIWKNSRARPSLQKSDWSWCNHSVYNGCCRECSSKITWQGTFCRWKWCQYHYQTFLCTESKSRNKNKLFSEKDFRWRQGFHTFPPWNIIPIYQI